MFTEFFDVGTSTRAAGGDATHMHHVQQVVAPRKSTGQVREGQRYKSILEVELETIYL